MKIDEITAGDILRIGNDRKAVIVLSVQASTATVAIESPTYQQVTVPVKALFPYWDKRRRQK